ncbi:hypothetical protein GCM10010912_69170 [Paenibacillus albidus]|uniref:Uncharacterized protein n=1 Tax=Paenibacillus albidus TaxID=2041023 RepID=A0A917FZ60_9BACL|nr:hypothetical protein GCM10010912_69170 [Paenibacillus albidus]
MEGQRGENTGIIRISYILGIIALLSIFLSTVLSITFSILSLIASFMAIVFYKNRRSVFALVFNVVVFSVLILGLYFIISNFTILE